METDDLQTRTARVPLGTVLLSMLALWLCYFAIATLRGVLMELGYQGEMLVLRLAVSAAGMAVTVLLWLLIRAFDRQRLRLRVAVAFVAAIPAALLLAFINQQVFADVERRGAYALGKQQGLELHTDEAGNLMVEVPDLPRLGERIGKAATDPEAAAIESRLMLWRQLTDIALSRYFLLLAWTGLYLALGQAESARLAERREGEHRRAAKAAELKSLRYQLNPHFLFNTLNSLSALVLTERTEQAEAMIQTLSTFYRRSLTGDPAGDVALSEEIELQRLYLQIEGVRFPDRLRVEIEVPDDLADCCIPGMILQPLIENSVKYAVAPLTRPVTIRIAAAEEYGRLAITIADNGPGANGAQNAGCGIGLDNVRKRLVARFGDEASVISGPSTEGWRTVVRMPLEREGACS